ncbi:MAG: ATP-binding protein [Hymenobacteraceae bacterium]|nr:ATP-binding protein [Hymenobacteraceae bacterium]MDX5397070.1 ATP-binding protein [Hymenobacteraceae bacterium]MDX5513140.1 ATP-binding protein [Hymenobacteraceae bacterium]
MQAIIFSGLQASGKTTFYLQHFFHTHLRINLDQLRTRHRENLFLQCCLFTQLRFVVDNTNPTKAERQKYILLAREARYEVICYYFETAAQDAISRNKNRTGKQFVPERGIYATLHKFEKPSFDEGFDKIYTVRIRQSGEFEIEEWQQE